LTERFSLEQIREFWTRQAAAHGLSPAASWSDRPVMELEIRTLLPYLNDGDRVLDVGCANGWSTIQFASQKRVSIRGLDYIPDMIESARKALDASRELLAGEVEFDVGNILDLQEPDASYDKVVVIRVLINLGNWEHQLRGLRECARVLRPGGLFLMSEATLQGGERLNSFRAEWKLPPIPMPPFNQYLDQKRVIEEAASELELVEVVDFASTYYVASRVLKPLLANLAGAEIDVANPEMEWNRFWSMAPAFGDYGTQKLFVFRKPQH
jgi:ubiquinone/menaquinone biosynthesis C-methylase UbiE